MANPYLQPPPVNYPTGDYRKISKLDRGRAETTKNSRLEAELAREKMWNDILFQKKLEELQKSVSGGGGTSSSVQFSQQPSGGSQIGMMGGGTSADRFLEDNPELSSYMQRLRGARMITGPNANPYALGYNFGTLSGKGGYFGKAAPVPDLPESAFGGRGGGGISESRLMEILRQLMGGR